MSASTERAAPLDQAAQAPELDPTCFVFGGVAFEMCPAPGLRWAVGSEHRLFRGAYATSPVAGRVHCVVSPAPELEAGFSREIHWEWSGDVAHVSTGGARAELRRLSPGCYAATALVVPSEAGCSALVTALTAAVVSREGGLVLHASGVELDGRAFLFIGPSGAGKTTAANHCQGGRWIAHDRAVVYPTRLGWYAAGICGGSDAIDLPPPTGRVFPLGCVARIRHAQDRVAVREATPVEAARYLRESLFAVNGTAEDEGARLETVLDFHATTPLRVLETKLGEPLAPHLRAAIGKTR